MKKFDTWHVRPLCSESRLRRWLVDRSSLTARIERCCDHFSVELVRQTVASPRPDERPMIDLRLGKRCVVREVVLKCNGRALVFARSVLMREALRGPWRRLVALGARPLGTALFADPRIRRYPLHFQLLRDNEALYCRAKKTLNSSCTALWARRSLFVSEGAPLLVTEVFLPVLAEYAP